MGRRIDGHIGKTSLPDEGFVLDAGLVVDVRVSNINETSRKIELQLINLPTEQEDTNLSRKKNRIPVKNNRTKNVEKIEDVPMEIDQVNYNL